jgi:hypothetical protein
MDVIRGFRSSHAFTCGVLVGGAVVHDQVQVLVRVSTGDLAQEREELLAAMQVGRPAGDLPGC